MTVVIDETLLEVPDKVYSHPADNTLSIGLKASDFVDLVTASCANTKLVSFAADPNAAPESEAPKQAKKSQAAQANKKKTVEKGQTLLALQWKKRENFAQVSVCT